MAAPEKLCWAPAATRHLVVPEGQSDLYPTAPPRQDETLTQEGDCVRGSVSLSVIELCHLGLQLHELCRRALPALDDRCFSAWRHVVAEHAVEPLYSASAVSLAFPASRFEGEQNWPFPDSRHLQANGRHPFTGEFGPPRVLRRSGSLWSRCAKRWTTSSLQLGARPRNSFKREGCGEHGEA